jgi:hypothetical protein
MTFGFYLERSIWTRITQRAEFRLAFVFKALSAFLFYEDPKHGFNLSKEFFGAVFFNLIFFVFTGTC